MYSWAQGVVDLQLPGIRTYSWTQGVVDLQLPTCSCSLTIIIILLCHCDLRTTIIVDLPSQSIDQLSKPKDPVGMGNMPPAPARGAERSTIVEKSGRDADET